MNKKITKEEYLKKLKEYTDAIKKTNLIYVKRDYEKAIKRLRREYANNNI